MDLVERSIPIGQCVDVGKDLRARALNPHIVTVENTRKCLDRCNNLHLTLTAITMAVTPRVATASVSLPAGVFRPGHPNETDKDDSEAPDVGPEVELIGTSAWLLNFFAALYSILEQQMSTTIEKAMTQKDQMFTLTRSVPEPRR
jgi:hypothetical protein